MPVRIVDNLDSVRPFDKIQRFNSVRSERELTLKLETPYLFYMSVLARFKTFTNSNVMFGHR